MHDKHSSLLYSYAVRKHQVKIYQDLIKMVSITLERLWMVCDRFSIFRQILQVQTCKNFQFLNYHGACKLSIKKAPNQTKLYHDLIKMLSVTLEKLW